MDRSLNTFLLPPNLLAKRHVQVDVCKTWFYKSKGFEPADPNDIVKNRNLNMLLEACETVDKENINAIEHSTVAEDLSPEKKFIERHRSKANEFRSEKRIPGVIKPLQAQDNAQLNVKQPVKLNFKQKKVAQRRDMDYIVHPPCVSCKCRKSPCWRPSWSPTAGQLCNSCGLRYRKMRLRCANKKCLHIPSKLDMMQCAQGECPECGERLIQG